MKEYRIVTHYSEGIREPDPWNAFIFEPEFEDQTPDDYIASNCGYLDEIGKISTGATEAEAVSNLFAKRDRKIEQAANRGFRDIFRKYSCFGHEPSSCQAGNEEPTQ